MKKIYEVKNYILTIVSLAIVIGSLFFGVQETRQLLDIMENNMTITSEVGLITTPGNIYIDSEDSTIEAVPEIRDIRYIREAVNRLESNIGSKRVIVFSLILILCLSLGAYYSSVLPSIFPWSSTVISRETILCYIHSQDGAK